MQGEQGDGALVDEGAVISPPLELLPGEFLYDPDAEPLLGETILTQDQSDARYVNNTGDAMTGPLTITTGTSPGVAIDRAAGTFSSLALRRGGLDHWRLERMSDDTFRIYHNGAADGGATVSPLSITKAGAANLSGPVTLPAATAAGQAAQVSAIDPATGRLAIGGIEMGNTGRRDIRSQVELIPFVVTAHTALVWRSGYTVQVVMDCTYNLSLIQNSVWQNIVPLDAGFSDVGNTILTQIPVYTYGNEYLGANWAIGHSGSYKGIAIYRSPNNVDTVRIRWNTSFLLRPGAAWPTTLPGVPA
jgi:hypothetical protein